MASGEVTSGCTVRVFGHVTAGAGSRQGTTDLSRVQTQLLAALVAAGPEGQPHDRLAEIVWPAGPPKSWYAALRLNVSRLRDQFPELRITAASGRYRLASPTADVDAWWLDVLIRSEAQPTEHDVRRAILGRPFDDVASGPLLDDARHMAEFHQRRLVERFRSVGSTSIEDDTATSLIAHAAREYTDTDTVGQVVTILEVADRADEAGRLLQTVTERHRSEIGYVPDELASRLRALVPQRVHPRAVPSIGASPKRHPALVTAAPLIPRSDIARSDIVDALTSPDSCLLLGSSGSGRTRLIAAAVDRIEATKDRYVYITPLADDSPPLAPLHVAIPSLTTLHVPPLGDRDRMAEAVREHWQHLLAAAVAGGQTFHYLVDDADGLDAPTLEVLRLLTHSSLGHSCLSVSLVADGDDSAPTWLALRHHLEHLKIPTRVVGPFARADIAAAVRSRFPHATDDAAAGLADDILRASGGLAALVITLLDAANPSTLRLPDRAVTGGDTSKLLCCLDDELRAVGVGAAVLGESFRLGSLVELLDLPAAMIERNIGALWSRELIDESDCDPERFHFRDMRLHHALVGSIPAFQLIALHRRAMDIDDDLHRRAAHAHASVPLCDTDTAVELLTDSARRFAVRDQWRSVALECERIDSLLGERTDAELLLMWADALDASGLDGSNPRERARDRADVTL